MSAAERRRWSCAPVDGDSVAVIGDNRKLLLFPLKELPEMPRGKGVRLQRYKDGGLADAKTFKKKEGLVLYRLCRPQLHSRPIFAIGGATAPRPAACRQRASPNRERFGAEILELYLLGCLLGRQASPSAPSPSR